MVTLAVEGKRGSELTYELNKPMISIGASSENDVVIRSPGVAPRHLVIQRNDGVFTFLGQNRQVVVLNGERRSRGVLRVGDRIRVGTATLIFKGVGESPVAVVEESAERPSPSPEATPSADAPSTARLRAEVVLRAEPHRLAEARTHFVEIFRVGVRSDLVPSLRTLLGNIFANRQAMLAWLQDGRFQPIVSQWTGEVPRLPARTFEELGASGRFAVLHHGAHKVLIYPVKRGELQAQAYLLVETTDDEQEGDEQLLAELTRILAVLWERVEESSKVLGAWEAASRKRVEQDLPGTSHATRVLRESVIQAARSPYPVLVCGRAGAGRMTTARLIAHLNPTGALPVHVFQALESDEAALRLELFGERTDQVAGGGLIERAKGCALVLRDIHVLSEGLQREMAATIRNDLETGYGPKVRWMATTDEDCMGLLTAGTFDSTLFTLFQRHTMRAPALEERREDLPLLIVRLLDAVGAEQGKEIRGIELETLNSLLSHTFDGQMTELVGELRRLVSATPDGEMVRGLLPGGPGVGPDPSSWESPAAPASLLSQDDLKSVIPAVERMIIDRVLRRTMGNQSKAARILNLSRGALIAKMKEFSIADYRYLRRGR